MKTYRTCMGGVPLHVEYEIDTISDRVIVDHIHADGDIRPILDDETVSEVASEITDWIEASGGFDRQPHEDMEKRLDDRARARDINLSR